TNKTCWKQTLLNISGAWLFDSGKRIKLRRTINQEGNMAQITIKEMISCGDHSGHQTHRWNPKMKNYVFGTRSGIHIIDLQKSVVMAQKAADFIKSVAAQGGRVLFVGTKKQASTVVKEAAEKCGQYYITKRWLGGTLTNFVTI